MATEGQVEFIADLLEKVGLTEQEAADLSGEPEWADYGTLPVMAASEMIDWLKEQKAESRGCGSASRLTRSRVRAAAR